jgi:protein-disulfide isomerase
VYNLRKQSLVFLFASMLLPRVCAAQSADAATKSPILGVVEGQPITEDDLAPQVQGQLGSLREQEYRIKKQGLDNLINQKLIEAEAKKKGISPDQLFEQEINAKVPEPTDAELRAVYAIQREQLNLPFEDAKAQLQQTMKKAKVQQALQEYITTLREQAKFSILLVAPQVQVGFDPARVRGNAKARVMIVEFADFQCPFCGQVQPSLKDLLAKHEGTVALAFRDMPLQKIHPLALISAEAARCAGEQGKFWEYHDLLYGDQTTLDRNGLISKAAKLQLDEKQFDSCLTGEKYKAQVEQDRQEGIRSGVSGTPGFFINGIFLSGAQPEAAFEKIIQEQLSASPKAQ